MWVRNYEFVWGYDKELNWIANDNAAVDGPALFFSFLHFEKNLQIFQKKVFFEMEKAKKKVFNTLFLGLDWISQRLNGWIWGGGHSVSNWHWFRFCQNLTIDCFPLTPFSFKPLAHFPLVLPLVLFKHWQFSLWFFLWFYLTIGDLAFGPSFVFF